MVSFQRLADGANLTGIRNTDAGGVFLIHFDVRGEIHQHMCATIVGDPEQEITQRVHLKQMVSHQHKEASFIARCRLSPHQGDPIAQPPVGSWQAADIEAVAIQLPHRLFNRIALAAHHQEDIQDAHFLQCTQVAREQGESQQVHQALRLSVRHLAQAVSTTGAQHHSGADASAPLFGYFHIQMMNRPWPPVFPSSPAGNAARVYRQHFRGVRAS